MKIFITLVTLFVSTIISAQHFNNELIILQNETSRKISTENEVISLKNQPFNIQFHSNFHHSKKENFNGLKIAVINDEVNLKVIEEGTPINLIPFFEEVF